jgi:lysophospholipid acyltransferase (LPLAT)-like uncharacterized protein
MNPASHTEQYNFGLPRWKRAAFTVLAYLYKAYMALVRITSRVDDSSMQPLWEALAKGRSFNGAVWHQDVLIGPFIYRGRHIVTMGSLSKDGDVIAYITRKLGFHVTRGSSSRGGKEALDEMISYMRSCSGVLSGLTIDGPRGPAGVAKMGVIKLARETGAPLVPVRTWAKRRILLNSWDRAMIPLPFNHIVALAGEAIPVLPDAEAEQMEAARQKLQAELHRLVREAEERVQTGAERGRTREGTAQLLPRA